MSMDFNDAESKGYGVIPQGTVVPLIMTVRPGKHGDGGWESTSAKSEYTWLDCEFTVTGGQYRNRKFWQNMMVSGPSDTAISITRSTLRGILESARQIKPDDESEAAKAKRIVTGYGDFSGLEFVAKVKVVKQDGYDDKNELLTPVPVTSPDYAKAGEAKPIGEVAQNVVNNAAAKQSAGGTPAWAQ